MQRLKEYLLSEKDKIKNLPSLQSKLTYIWQYYCLWIIGFVTLICFTVFTIFTYYNTVGEYYIYVTFANTRADIGEDSKLYDEYIEYRDFDLSQCRVGFNNQAYFDYGKDETGNTYFESFITYTDAGTLDAVTMEKDSLILMGQSGRLIDLNSEACLEIKEKYEDRFVYAKPYDEEYSTDLVPIGIDISDSILMTKYNIYPESCVLGIGAFSHRIDEVEKFLEFVLEE